MKAKAAPFGNIKLRESKLTAAAYLEKPHMPRVVHIPLSQHSGTPARLLVQTGQIVVEGQLIGEAEGAVSANIHASISGKIIKIEKAKTLLGKEIEVVSIETGGPVPNWYEKKLPYSHLSAQQLLEDIKKAGVVGLGGAVFPTHCKLAPVKDRKITHLIINGAESEPYLTSDHRLMLEKTNEIIEGIRIIMKITNAGKAVIAIEENKPDALAAFTEKLANDKSMEIIPLKVCYPQGGEKQLVKTLFGREVPAGKDPQDIGLMVENVATVFAVYEAVVFKKPLIERSLTFSGDEIPSGRNIKVRIGTPIHDLLQEFGMPGKFSAVIAGGPMMGQQINDFNMPVIKCTNGVIVLPKRKDAKVKNKPCIRCGKCLDACPATLQPHELANLCELDLLDAAVKEMGLFDCVECGNCAYVCPSTIPITALIRYGKQTYQHKLPLNQGEPKNG